jgi:hypothetical protein
MYDVLRYGITVLTHYLRYFYHFGTTATLLVGETEQCVYIKVLSLHF